ncbi:AMP-binding protein [Actinoplanes sp. NPDC049316]|uniref:AMP-binding protein n=1 Tax=Actinoplanes sp. NPDC049316 TaxID=3154727 RepID=UPI00343BF4B7
MTMVSLWGGEPVPGCLFGSLTEADPDRVALVDGELLLTYAGLLAWARRIADLLDEHGVRAGDMVAVTGPRGAATTAAMLGITYLGAVYVPLDPEYPRRRLTYMLDDSGAQVLLHTGAVPQLGGTARLLAIPGPYDGAAPGDRKPVDCRPDLGFYAIYTSGSTGWPKGVVIPHSCLDAMVSWQAGHSPQPDLRTAQFAPLNFDVSFQEILGTLRGGGTVVYVPEELRRHPAGLLSWLVANRIERLFLPYMALQMLAIAVTTAADVSGVALREVNVAGEQLVVTGDIRTMFRRLPAARLVNHYGQSESAMVTSHVLPADVDAWPAIPPIGVPLPGCEVLVDPPDPAEPEVGELLVAGLPVSLGYLHRPELNADRFRTVPPTPRGHTTVFRTGDLVRAAGGTVTFLSRVDSQVKIRGVRIDLAEVDAHLLGRPGVKAAACVSVPTPSGTRKLRAAVTAHDDGPPPDVYTLRQYLREVLPEASVPASITVLPELPRTPSGKIDRDAVAGLVTAALGVRPGFA